MITVTEILVTYDGVVLVLDQHGYVAVHAPVGWTDELGFDLAEIRTFCVKGLAGAEVHVNRLRAVNSDINSLTRVMHRSTVQS